MPNPLEYSKRGRKAYLLKHLRPDNGKRTTMRLGTITKSQAKEIGVKVEQVLNTIKYGLLLPAELHHWLSQLEEKTYDKFVKGGLVLPRTATLVPGLERFITDYCHDQVAAGTWKPRTQEIRKQCVRDLVRYFGADKKLMAITPGDADDWFLWLQKDIPAGRGLSTVTVAKRLKDAKQFFAYAMRKKHVEVNPFDGIRVPSQDNPDRAAEITTQTFSRVLERIDHPELRLILALGRYGGLRIPSEPTALRWGDIDFEKTTMQIRSPKTERHSNAIRRCPIFPELVPFLLAVRPEAFSATDFVLTEFRGNSGKYRKRFESAIRSVGLVPWPRLFHNLRANAFTDLCDRNSMAQVCKWLGNSIRMGEKHYLLIRQHEYDHSRSGGTPIVDFDSLTPSRGSGEAKRDKSGTKNGTVSSGQEHSQRLTGVNQPSKTRGNQ